MMTLTEYNNLYWPDPDYESVQAEGVRIDCIVVLREHICRVSGMTTSKQGKQGRAKIRITGSDVDSNKVYNDAFPYGHTLRSPVRRYEDLIDVDIESRMCTVVSENCNVKYAKLPEGKLGAAVRRAFEQGRNAVVTVQKADGQRHIIAVS
ncbi:hypothetical protein Pelo_130 [Pelomyxa schiedti]|nr:hypothetical protein Pelo_130 [Pelomyxa schiedti]